jgi:hypothetical protein
MDSTAPDNRLRRYQDSLRKEDLLAYLEASSRRSPAYERALDALEPVLRPLGFGFQPALGLLDREALRADAGAVSDILSWIADSGKADAKTAGLTVMGALGWDVFLPRLERSLASPVEWERETAQRALELWERAREGN